MNALVKPVTVPTVIVVIAKRLVVAAKNVVVTFVERLVAFHK